MIKQKILGVITLFLCVVIMALAAQGDTVEEHDVTPILFLFPLGITLLVTREDALNAHLSTKKEALQWDERKSRRSPSSARGKTWTPR